jgi:acyl carrier protein
MMPTPMPLSPISRSGSSIITNTESTVKDIWSSVLNVDKSIIDSDSSYFDVGGDSMSSVVILSKLAKITDRKLSLNVIYKYQSLRSLAGYIDRGDEDEILESASIDWAAEIKACRVLTANIAPLPLEPAIKTGPIVLTGATGFLGIHLLYDLLLKTNRTVICVAVRADSDLQAMSRVLGSLENLFRL